MHLTDHDHEKREHSPFSPEIDASMETLDARIGQIRTAALAIDPRTRIVIASCTTFCA